MEYGLNSLVQLASPFYLIRSFKTGPQRGGEREGGRYMYIYREGEREREREGVREGESDSGGYLLSSTGISYGSKYALGIFYRSKYPPLSICYHK